MLFSIWDSYCRLLGTFAIHIAVFYTIGLHYCILQCFFITFWEFTLYFFKHYGKHFVVYFQTSWIHIVVQHYGIQIVGLFKHYG